VDRRAREPAESPGSVDEPDDQEAERAPPGPAVARSARHAGPAGAVVQAARRVPGVLQERPARPLDHAELAGRPGTLQRHDLELPAQGEAAAGLALRRDDRELVRQRRSLDRRCAWPVAVHARGRKDLRPARRPLGRRAPRSVPLDDRADGLLRRPLPAVRRLAHRARRVQRRLRRDACARSRATTRTTTTGCASTRTRSRGRPACTRRKSSRPRSSATIARCSAWTSSPCDRPRRGTRSPCRRRCRSR